VLIFGLLVVFGSVVIGYVAADGALGVLWQPPEYLIIGGAAIGSLLISTPKAVLMNIVAQLGAAVRGAATTRADYANLLAMLYQIFRTAQQSGVMSLEAHFDDPAKSSVLTKYPGFLARHHAVEFLADSIKVIIVGGLAPHDLEALMDEDLRVQHEDEIKPSTAMARVADALPGLGIVAAVLGVVITMGRIDGPPEQIGYSVGAALVGTFLGVALSYGVAQPIANHLEARVNEDAAYCQCIKASVVAMYKGSPPAIAVEFGRRVLPVHLRPSFDETEQFCRAAAPARTERVAA
jgi:chemotaxis protein MotA